MKALLNVRYERRNHSEYNMRNSPQPVRWIILRPVPIVRAMENARAFSQKFLYFAFYIFFWCVYTTLPFREYSASARARKHFTNYTVCNKKCKTLYRPSWKLDFCFERLFCWQRFFSKSVYHMNMKRKLTIHLLKSVSLTFKNIEFIIYCIQLQRTQFTHYYYCLVQFMCFFT